MIKIFYGENRVKAKESIDNFLGADYEIIEGDKILVSDLASIFMGGSLFQSERKILIKDLSENKEVFLKLVDFVNTPHKVAIFEMKLDKRSSAYKDLKNKVEIVEFVNEKNINAGLVFDIFKVAKRDGKKAVEMLDKIIDDQDPYMFFGLLVSQALKDFSYKQGTKEKRVLDELSKLDIEMKTSSMQPWLLLKSFLLQVSLQ